MKIKLIFFMMWICIAEIKTVNACDACACGISSSIGLFTNFKTNFIRLNYSISTFGSNPFHETQFKDYFNQLEISSRYAISKKVRLNVTIPYIYNSRIFLNSKSDLKGIGDTKLWTNYVFWQNEINNQNIYFEAGAGCNLPTGRYDAKLHELNLPENFNIGKGMYAALLQSNFVYSFKKIGILQSNNFQYNIIQKNKYRFGNLASVQLSFFNEWKINNIKLVPNIGIAFEKTFQDHYATNLEVPNTGGKILINSYSLNFKTKNLFTGFGYSMALFKKQLNNEMRMKNRFTCQISYLF